MATRRPLTDHRIAAVFLGTAVGIAAAVLGERLQYRKLVVEELMTGRVYAEASVKPGDTVVYRWTHSFEKIPWDEYYEILADGSFQLNTISVAGFGAGIPAEMDVPCRYEDGLIWMDGIGSVFPQFNWINSNTALREIDVNEEVLLRGSDMPHHEKMVLYIKTNIVPEAWFPEITGGNRFG